MKIRALAAIGVASALLLTGCGGSSGGTSAPATPAAAPQTLTVLAAASLTETFNALGKQFETDHPGVVGEVQLRAARPTSRSRSSTALRPTCSPPPATRR